MSHGFPYTAHLHLCVWSQYAGRSSFSFTVCGPLVPSAFNRFNEQPSACFSQVVWAVDEVTLLNPPEEPRPGHLLKILYSCDEVATVRLDCVVSFETGSSSTLLLRQWSCAPGPTKVKTLELNLPDWLVYRADGIIPDSQLVLSCILVVSLRYSGLDDTEASAAAQDMATLQPKLFFSRPLKRHQLCISWSTQMMQLSRLLSKKQCPLEQGKV